jgi:cytochrome b subunit of formate dehydrogenase
MVMTGTVMRWSPPFSSSFATGATFFHDLGFVALTFAVLAHIAVALYRPDQLSSMVTGRIPLSWAKEHAPAWLKEVTGDEVPPVSSGAAPPPRESARQDVEARTGS